MFYMKGLKYIILLILTIPLVSCFAIIKQEEGLSSPVLIKAKNSSQNILIGFKDKEVIIYEYRNKRATVIERTDIGDSIHKIFIDDDKKCYLYSRAKLLYLYDLTTNKAKISRIMDLSENGFNYLLDVYNDTQALNILGIKVTEAIPPKVTLSLVKVFPNKKVEKYQIHTFNSVQSIQAMKSKIPRIVVVSGYQEMVKDLFYYELAANKLKLLKKFDLTQLNIEAPSFFTIKNDLYVNGLKVNINTNEGFEGVFKFNLDDGQVKEIYRPKSPVNWLEIGDFNGNGEKDIIWANDKGLYIEYDWKSLN